jgi:coenzyme F420-reducing hydrogenase gamma subunit
MPLTAYVKVDFLIHGCPINNDELIRILEDLIAGKKPSYRNFSVCYECKINNNSCRLLNNKPCLGPIIQGGCKAICISGGSPCYGCFGLREDANIKALLKILTNIIDEKEIKKYFSMFLNKENLIKY